MPDQWYGPAILGVLPMAIDRGHLVEIGYGRTGREVCNILPAPAIYASTANDACLYQNGTGARRLLSRLAKTGDIGERARLARAMNDSWSGIM